MAANPPTWAPPFSANDAEVIWDGTTTDLLAADALVQCTETQKRATGELRPNLIDHDSYLQVAVVGKMGEAIPTATLADDPGGLGAWSVEQRWQWVRTKPEYNCDPVTHTPGRPVSFKTDGGVLESIPVVHFSQVESWSIGATAANSDLRTAGMNLCIAQYLRKASPGASSGQTLLLDDAEQRWLLEVIRERSQIAMLHYALLGAVFSRTDYDFPTGLQSNQTVDFLGWWAGACAAHDPLVEHCDGNLLADMGRDFATAVQLHAMVTEELAQLFGRSGSARLQRGGAADTRADDVWGPESWKQRLDAFLFGGDPLAIEVGGPWQHPLNSAVPGAFQDGTWPDGARVPYFRTDLAEPQVDELLALARRYDRIGINRQPQTCFAVDVKGSADLLFDSVEAHLRKDACSVQLSGGACETNLQNLMPTPTTPLDQTLLWQHHRITRDHATTLIKHLGELLTFKGGGVCGTQIFDPNDFRMGPLNVDGTVASSTTYPPQPLPLPDIIISPPTKFVEPPPRDIAPKYTRFAQLRIPDPEELLKFGDSGRQGFSGCGGSGCEPGGVSINTEAKRLMGAISAEAAVRRSLMGSLNFLNTNPGGVAAVSRLNDYFAHSQDILKVISGAIGDDSFSLRPWIVPTTSPTGTPDVAVLTIPTQFGARQIWNIQGTIAKEDDAFWAPGNTVFVCSAENALAGNLGAQPTSTIFGATVLSVLTVPAQTLLCGIANRVTPDIAGAPPRWGGFAVTRGQNPDGTFTSLAPTFIAVSSNLQDFRLLGSQYALIGSVTDVFQGQYLASGGQIGVYLDQQRAHREGNPVEPKFDGFGYATDWVPPLSAELIGGQPGEDSASHFLSLAKDSATEATAAVEKATDELIQTEQDEVAEAAAAAKSDQGIQEDKQALCGPSSVCPPALVTTGLSPDWYPSKPTLPQNYPTSCPANPQSSAEIQTAIDCLVHKVFDGFMQMQVKIAQPVLDQIKAPAAPAFADFSGGALQPAFVKQWAALRAPDEKFKSLVAAANAAKAEVDLSKVVLDVLNLQIQSECGWNGKLNSVLSGLSIGVPSGISFSGGPAQQHEDKCFELALQVNTAQQKVITTAAESMAAVTSAIQGTVDAQAAIQLSSADIEGLMNQASLADARNTLEKKLAAENATTSFGLVRRFRAYDLWRAKALVENARRYALAARRAIEARYVVNLSTLSQPESFVASPATWSDEVYSYDLSLPKSVGLATGEPQPGGIYANKVKDYVTNLEGFVSGYAVSRPAAVAKDEIDVLTLPGMASQSPYYIDPVSGQECSNPPDPTCVVRYADRGDWLVHCAKANAWKELIPNKFASAACGDLAGEFIDFARIEFEMDPWGRLNRSTNSEPFQKRFNGRWGPLAVNIVGTGVKNCKLASDQLGCYSSAFVPYNLTHVGPAWVTDYDEIWRQQGVPIGQIEGGKAIAAEIWLDPLKDGWSTNYISAVKRSELELRPLGGAYELELAFGPEVNVDHIERLQMLVGSTYWVKQQ